MSSKTIPHTADLPSLVERYFSEYLMKQRNASPETISSYRDAFRLSCGSASNALHERLPH